jgi:hypothetical protein
MHKKLITKHQTELERLELYEVLAVELACELIKRHPTEHIHIPMLADKAALTKFQLQIGIPDLFRVSQYRYRLRMYLESIEESLDQTDNTIDHI